MKKQTKPPHEPTKASRDTVSLHAMVGTTQADIARVLGIDEKTLRKYYRDELDLALAKANATIGGALFNKAKSGDTSAQMFWLKTRARFKETVETVHSGSINATVKQITHEMDPQEATRLYQDMINGSDSN